MTRPKIGFIGQGWLGKHLADEIEQRGYDTVRYSKEEPYSLNKDRIRECDIVFVAVPTPTTPDGYDASILRTVLPLVGNGNIAVLKSTIYPGLTKKLQQEFSDLIILHCPEFLSEATASYDVAHPFINIVGMAQESPKHRQAAELLLDVLPETPYASIVSSEEAELIKYAHNCSGYTQIIFFNIMYDLAQQLGANWHNIESALKADPFIPTRYASPIHKSGRGAGGHCFPKDFEALIRSYREHVEDALGLKVLESNRDKNIELLKQSGKDADIVKGVYNI